MWPEPEGTSKADIPDHLDPPKAIENFPESDYNWLLQVINDMTLDENIRVLCARILSCTFANDLGRSSFRLISYTNAEPSSH